MGVVSTSNCNAHFTDGYTCSQVDYALINQVKINEFQNTHKIAIGSGTYTLSSDGLVKDGKKIENVSLISKTNVGYVSYKNSFDDKNNCDKRIEEMQNSKDLYFSQNGNIN